jgi:hypothetical protein
MVYMAAGVEVVVQAFLQVAAATDGIIRSMSEA